MKNGQNADDSIHSHLVGVLAFLPLLYEFDSIYAADHPSCPSAQQKDVSQTRMIGVLYVVQWLRQAFLILAQYNSLFLCCCRIQYLSFVAACGTFVAPPCACLSNADQLAWILLLVSSCGTDSVPLQLATPGPLTQKLRCRLECTRCRL